MDQNIKIRELKIALKRLAANIREVRRASKELQRNPTAGWMGPKEYVPLSYAVYWFRHMHIAYGLLRGRQYEQIESKVKEGNEPNHEVVAAIVERGAMYFGSEVAIRTLDNKSWVWKRENSRYMWDAEFAELKEIKDALSSFGSTSFGHLSPTGFQALCTRISKFLGRK